MWCGVGSGSGVVVVWVMFPSRASSILRGAELRVLNVVEAHHRHLRGEVREQPGLSDVGRGELDTFLPWPTQPPALQVPVCNGPRTGRGSLLRPPPCLRSFC